MCFLTLVSLFKSSIKTVLSNSNEPSQGQSSLKNKWTSVWYWIELLNRKWSSQSEYMWYLMHLGTRFVFFFNHNSVIWMRKLSHILMLWWREIIFLVVKTYSFGNQLSCSLRHLKHLFATRCNYKLICLSEEWQSKGPCVYMIYPILTLDMVY